MTLAIATRRTVSLFIATLYLFFSCLYVTRCAKSNIIINAVNFTGGLKTSNGAILKCADNKPAPVVFLSRPRVIFSKNLISFTAPFTLLTQTAVFIALHQPGLNTFIRNLRPVQSRNLLSLIHYWRI